MDKYWLLSAEILKDWEPLKKFFKAEFVDIKTKSVSSSTQVAESIDKPYAHKKVENILMFLISPTNKLFVLFLDFTVKMYDDVLVGLQSDEPKMHVLSKMLVNQIVKALCHFFKPAAM
ncbi:hypothetical protein CHS0354_038240 [Potamilus streckersoni]|uniref:Uncharacterized protein n=1 Tax=Potamilus streckersoni TaxID=2493646 RepID=A0AAE0T1W4_9BIVA|nr:hypothetical protein CHS0354_038240 [Potamilus streckersoni]